jgi:predicted Rossmann fold nucleotide-binding protein DprA/Smf involved in DNA uptake
MSKKIAGDSFKPKHEYDEQMKVYRRQYEEWRNQKREESAGFFPVFSDFKPLLDQLTGNALKLYLFLGFHADNKTGETTVGLETIAHHFGSKMRTVQDWMHELTKVGLVARVQTGYRYKAHTFLLPYSSKEQPTDDAKMKDA